MKIIGHSTKNTLLKIMIILGIILVLEVILFLVYKHYNKTCYNILSKEYNDVLILDDGYITIGSNNYKGTDEAKYNNDKLVYQGEITKLDNKLNIIWNTTYYLDSDINLVGIVKINNGYIVIGTIKKQSNDETDYTGLLLKLDSNGKILDTKEYDLLNNTIFRKIVRDNNTNIIIGGSQYEQNRIGNHLGGGIILKVDDNLNITEQNNYGGNKSGEFTNIFILKDSYLVTGIDAGYHIIVKFSKNFNRVDNDTDLISKKVIYYRTIDKDITFNPIYYSNNKLYDGIYEYDLNNDNLIKTNLDNKNILLINDSNIYAYDDKLYVYDRDYKLIKEINSNNYITKLLINKNNLLSIKTICNKCICNSKIEITKDE